MRIHEVLTEQQLDELNRRDFLKTAGWTAMGAGLTAAGLDQGKHEDDVVADIEKQMEEVKAEYRAGNMSKEAAANMLQKLATMKKRFV